MNLCHLEFLCFPACLWTMHTQGRLKGKPPPSVFTIFATLPPDLMITERAGRQWSPSLGASSGRGETTWPSSSLVLLSVAWESRNTVFPRRQQISESLPNSAGVNQCDGSFQFAFVAHWWLQLRRWLQILNVTRHNINPHWLQADHFSDVSGSISCRALTARSFNPNDIPLLNPLSSYFPFGQRVGFYALHPDMVPVQCVGWCDGGWNVILWGDVVPVDCLRHRTVLPSCDGVDSPVVPLDDPVSAWHVGTPKTYAPALQTSWTAHW